MDYKTLPMASLPRTQALSSVSFKPPPLDGSLTVPEMYDWHLAQSPGHSLLVYTDSENEETVIPWGKGVLAVYRVANEIRRRIAKAPNAKHEAPTVIAILSAADTITYFLNIAGIFRAGYTVFPISPRNSPAAVAHLLQKGKVSHILVGEETASHTLALNALNLLTDDSKPHIQTSALPMFHEIYNLNYVGEWTDSVPSVKFDLDCVALILHSSGSTAFPKPIYWTHYRLIQLAWTPYFGERDMCGTRFACHSMPMFHGMGVMQTGWTATSGLIITSFEPRDPPILPSPDSVIESSVASKSDIIFCVPSFIEAWSKDKDHLSSLCKIHGVLYGGGPLNQEVGDRLSNEGVSIFILYGCSEVGIMSPIVPAPVRTDWNYFRLSGNIKGKLRPDSHGNYELVVLPNPYEVPSVFNTVEDGVDAYATSDLLSPHPEKSGFWKIHGRVDDQIMHSNGEKTNPGPLENILNQDPRVRSAVMFGRGRFNAGIIVDPKPEFMIDSGNAKALGEFRQSIWSTVERMNDYAPQHSRIFKEMILVASQSKPFTYTAKNTARRQAIIEDYAEEIDALYAAVQETTQSEIPLPPSWSLSDTLSFTREVVKSVMKLSIKDDVDFFYQGCDSLQATWIRNTILNALQRSGDAQIRSIPINFVYQNPSIVSLSSYVSRVVVLNGNSTQQDATEQKVKAMEAMVLKYSGSFKPHVPSALGPQKDVVLITGTTGGLGTLLLINLLNSPDVERVYALNRNGEGLRTRQLLALTERQLNPNTLDSSKLVLLGANLEVQGFGLEAQTFREIMNTVTHIIHNAYPVNFNMALPSFEPSVATLRLIIDLALASPLPDPPRVLFTSSISVVQNAPGNEPVPEIDVESSAAVGSGYSESKWICEKLLGIASRETSLKPITIRIGQLSGMRKGGYWNPKEWVPALVKSSIHIGCLPNLDTSVSWLPIDTAAEAILEMRNSSLRILHLAHPHPVSWTSIFDAVSKELSVPLVAYDDWLHAVDSEDQAVSGAQDAKIWLDNPALRIIDFFRSSIDDEGGQDYAEGMGLKRLSLEEAMKNSSELRNAKGAPLSGANAKEWLVSWRKTGFLPS